MKRILLLISYILLHLLTNAQQIKILTSHNKISLRGLSVMNDNIIWASGSDGQVARSINGGKDFEWITVKGYEQRDFRDIEAFDANTALIMAVDTPAVILKTKDGGETWSKVFYDDTPGMFLDAMDNGFVIGDPINSKMFLASSSFNGESWKKESIKNLAVENGEACFAASGTNLKVALNKKYNLASLFFVTGGTKSRLFFDDSLYNLNIVQGKETTGANSIDINSKQKGVIVGGDFLHDSSTEKNCVLFTYNGRQINFLLPQTYPHGYRSCVAFITEGSLICCGLTGVDISNDSGLNWKLISDESFNVCAKAKKGNTVFLAGKDGRIAKLMPAP
ncbi:MAG: oxidoreductase [Parafilimonas sp.]|nr:oxidoreductase [Parafilimonas sp.]